MIMTIVRPLPVTPERIPYGPSDAPALDYPEYDPTPADLDAVELLAEHVDPGDLDIDDLDEFGDYGLGLDRLTPLDALDDRLVEAAILAGYEHKRRELHSLRPTVLDLVPAVHDEPELVGCAA